MSAKLSSRALPRGFRFAATACGLKRRGPHGLLDLGLIVSDGPSSAAAVFTRNLVQAAPVVLSRAHVRASAGAMRAVIVNSGNANCSTGPAGMDASRATAERAARALGCRSNQVAVCSTGVIGVPLQVERILKAVPSLVASAQASAGAFAGLARAILTTDTRPKWAAARARIGGREVRFIGCAKGAGMIHPNMATMLAFVMTDAAIAPRALDRALREVVARTFNSISVDGDTSTNDTLLVMATGGAGARRITSPQGGDYANFVRALEQVCLSLALAIVGDGEGATRVLEIIVRGARSDRAAAQVARTVAGSSLVKTALSGADPNWGRILAAAGRAGVPFDPDRVEIWLGGMRMYGPRRESRVSVALPLDDRGAHRRLLARYIPIVVDLRRGRGQARFWTCDFTKDYVDINASYRT
jgi:glutamate N-acetyltransferase / amino-acid N-acetyltransferase